MKKKFIAILTSVAMSAALITGCGAGAAGGSGKSEAIADGVLTVGTNAEFPPFEYVGDNGEP
ncbi:MAG: basic amino acid ABC transporter substrate-binding protein, partial [Lachnospiraceae bacterium]|nr:basic amino acid ABC transporter substrate-binding protein [Lachnospiraceae bacterium]